MDTTRLSSGANVDQRWFKKLSRKSQRDKTFRDVVIRLRGEGGREGQILALAFASADAEKVRMPDIARLRLASERGERNGHRHAPDPFGLVDGPGRPHPATPSPVAPHP